MATKERSKEERERNRTSSPGREQKGGMQNPNREQEQRQSRERERGNDAGRRSGDDRGNERRR